MLSEISAKSQNRWPQKFRGC